MPIFRPIRTPELSSVDQARYQAIAVFPDGSAFWTPSTTDVHGSSCGSTAANADSDAAASEPTDSPQSHPSQTIYAVHLYTQAPSVGVGMMVIGLSALLLAGVIASSSGVLRVQDQCAASSLINRLNLNWFESGSH